MATTGPEDDAEDEYDEHHPLHTTDVHSFQRLDIDQENGADPLPKFLREPSHKSLRRYLPRSLERLLFPVIDWSAGPERPQTQKIIPAFGTLQHTSTFIRDRFTNNQRQAAFCSAVLLWAILIFSGVRRSSRSLHVDGYGVAKPITCMQQAW